MPEFVIRPHGRLHDWVAHEKGYFRNEGLSWIHERDIFETAPVCNYDTAMASHAS
jgi:hypothetical protein